jgi:drug/metabolite transporter (DMT)-like permease
LPRFDLRKPFSQTGDTLKKFSAFNPITIHKKGTRVKALFALAMVCFFWGTTWIASKKAVSYNLPPMQMAGLRQLLGGAVYVIFFLSKGRIWPRGKEWGPILMLSFLNFMLSNGLSTWGVKYISAGLGSIIGAIFPLWLVFIGLFKSQKIPAKAILGIIIGFAGICVIFYEHLEDFLNTDFTFGIILSLIATWAWAFGTLYTKQQAASFNPYFSLGLQMMISGVVLYSVSGAVGISIPVKDIPWQSWAAISYLVIFGSVISFIAYLYALQRLPTEQASIYAYINPIVAVLFGALIFNEKLTLFIAIGGLITLLGVYLVNQVYRTSGKEEKKIITTQPSS